ncbi:MULTISPECIES: hypothetical protein [Vibrio]|uniref:Uncharacterized protein n=2 Tax=Vibrio TaxID=662 RepID=A0A5P9CRH4_9VIBR|nr:MULTISPECIES: hypothetical protein [Vibrio]MYM61612.1 hypothetical protein [Vibrio tetraodonis subsp. pristinus]QFT28810.1 hypothetical protein FIV01_20625 [Vibrio aquimaris]
MSFTPKYSLADLAKIAGFDDVDEMVKYSCTSRQNLYNWNNREEKQNFLKVVIRGAQAMKSDDIRIKAQMRANNK